MKKFLCVILSALLLFSMTACQSAGKESPADDMAAPTWESQNPESTAAPTQDTQGPESAIAPEATDSPDNSAVTEMPGETDVTNAPEESDVTRVPDETDVTETPEEPQVTLPVQTGTPSPTDSPAGVTDPTGDTTDSHTAHSFGTWSVTTAATCTKAGNEERICTVCDEKETRSTKATGHSYGDWKITKTATCTASGTRERDCKSCGVAQTETVTASHNWSSWKTTQTESYYWIDENNDVVGKKPAVRSRSCSLCGATKSEEYVVSDDEKDALALAVAKKIVAQVDSKTYATDLERVQAAANIVAAYSQSCIYHHQDTKPKDYKTAYGVFVAGIYTCAGSARAMGLVLDCMGYKWEHANPNGYTHQWCILTMDGQVGFADGQVGWVDYGEHPAASW